MDLTLSRDEQVLCVTTDTGSGFYNLTNSSNPVLMGTTTSAGLFVISVWTERRLKEERVLSMVLLPPFIQTIFLVGC